MTLRGVGKRLTARDLSQPHGCAYTLWLAKKWKQRAARAEANYKRWVAHFVLRAPDDWRRAIDEVQKVYPGTKGWLLSCSASEGGWGRWFPNSQGSGVGGWMQMYPSTFWRMFTAAKADAESRGFNVPASAASWYSPLGQALGSAWGLTHGRRGEWMGAGCR